jgi:hypothetical protein
MAARPGLGDGRGGAVSAPTPIVRAMVRVASGWFVLSALASLLAVDLLSWARCADLRRGRVPGFARSEPLGPPRLDPGSRSSRTTWLAAAAGAGLAVRGAVGLDRAAGTLVLAAGLAVALAGVARRVRAVEAASRELLVRYGVGPPFRLPWSACSTIRPPRTPVGAWRLVGPAGAARLMPSDLLGREVVLRVLVERSGLRFDGRAWTRTAAAVGGSAAGPRQGAGVGRSALSAHPPPTNVMVPCICVGCTSQWKK